MSLYFGNPGVAYRVEVEITWVSPYCAFDRWRMAIERAWWNRRKP
jgi:hypothetical protein